MLSFGESKWSLYRISNIRQHKVFLLYHLHELYCASMKSTTLLFLCFLKLVRIKENKWSIFTFLGIFIVSITKQIEWILNDIRVYEHNQHTIENRNVLSLIPGVTTSCCDRFLASSAHTHDQRLYAPLWYPIPLGKLGAQAGSIARRLTMATLIHLRHGGSPKWYLRRAVERYRAEKIRRFGCCSINGIACSSRTSEI